MRTTKLLAISLLMAITVLSCEKTEGPGGTSTIMGRVYMVDYNNEFTIKLAEFYAPDVDVFIVYGKDSIYSDDFTTGEDGWYRFRYLRKGTYTVYALSKDITRQLPGNVIPVKKTVTIADDGETIVVDDLVIFD